jgi:hypothetical protein
MVLTPFQQQLVVIGFWVVMLLIAAFILRLACGLFQANIPSWKRAIFMVLFVGPAAYLVFDFSAYLIFLSIKDVLIRVPPGYGYGHWFWEPLPLKWYVISMVPLVKYLPIVFALCIAGTLQAITLQLSVTFRGALVIFLVQWVATAVAFVLLLIGVNLALSFFGVKASYEGTAPPPATPGAAAPPTQKLPEGHTQIEIRETVETAAQTAWTYVENLKNQLDPYLDEVKQTLEPVTRYLPQPAQTFLEDGGWWVVFGIIGAIALIFLLMLLHRFMRALFRPWRRKKKKRRTKFYEMDLNEDLAPLAQVFTEEGPERITVKGLPARVRLVLLAAGSRDVGELHEDSADRLLDMIRPGLAKVVAHDAPRVRLWPPQYSPGGFPTIFAHNMRVPDLKESPSRWVLVSGTVAISRQKVHVGMALLTDKPSLLRQVVVKGSDWPGVLGVEAPARAS